MKSLQISIIVLLVALSVQGWLGDYVNLFAVFPTGPVTISLGGLAQALQKAGIMEVIHATLGFIILAMSIAVLAFSFKERINSLRITSIIGLAAVASALAGGLLFVFSGFANNGNSAQMGGSFIGAYAFYFIELYYLRGSLVLAVNSKKA